MTSKKYTFGESNGVINGVLPILLYTSTHKRTINQYNLMVLNYFNNHMISQKIIVLIIG